MGILTSKTWASALDPCHIDTHISCDDADVRALRRELGAEIRSLTDLVRSSLLSSYIKLPSHAYIMTFCLRKHMMIYTLQVFWGLCINLE